MSLEAIQKVTEVEKKMYERKAATDLEAYQMISDADKAGLLQLEAVRQEAIARGKTYLESAEQQAEVKAAEIRNTVIAEGDVLRQEAEKHLDKAVEFIVGRVVNQ